MRIRKDVTVHYEPVTGKPEEFFHYFFQVKYHENQAQHYSSAKLLEKKENGRNLLAKFFQTWRKLKAEHPKREVKLHLVNNWSWTQEGDKLGRCEAREPFSGTATKVACGISVTGSLNDDVRNHLDGGSGRAAAAVLFLRPERDLGRDCLRSAGDAAALARGAKDVIRSFVKEWSATRLLLYYFGPLSGACFLGHQLNAVSKEIVIMDDQQPGYSATFVL